MVAAVDFNHSPLTPTHKRIHTAGIEDKSWEVWFAKQHKLTTQELKTLETPEDYMLVSSRQCGYARLEAIEIYLKLDTNILLCFEDMIELLQHRLSHRMRMLVIEYCLHHSFYLDDLFPYTNFTGEAAWFLDSFSYKGFIQSTAPQEKYEEEEEEEESDEEVSFESTMKEDLNARAGCSKKGFIHSIAQERDEEEEESDEKVSFKSITKEELNARADCSKREFMQMLLADDFNMWLEKLVECAECLVIASADTGVIQPEMRQLMYSFELSDLKSERIAQTHLFNGLFDVKGDSQSLMQAYHKGAELQEELAIHSQTYKILQRFAAFLDNREKIFHNLIFHCDTQGFYKEFKQLFDIEKHHMQQVFDELKRRRAIADEGCSQGV